MANDYRNTDYCPNLSGVKERKKDVKEIIKADHPKAKDFHRYLSDNSLKYKKLFARAYNFKCAYCGVSIDIISINQFEIDHVVFKESFDNKVDAGIIENLVLACHECNHNKGGFFINEEHLSSLHPDEGLSSLFIRDDAFNIRISDEKKCDTVVRDFYEKLKLNSELRRIDYLLMSMKGLVKQIEDLDVSKLMHEAINMLTTKRNLI